MVSVSNHERRWSPAPIAAIAALAVVFLGFHFRFLPQSLEDLDSINFALGVRHYDVAEHQPHPPGYPMYILLGKAVRLASGSELRALTVLSILGGTCGIFAIASLFGRIDAGNERAWPLAGALLAAASPLYWFTSTRPLSDVPGLAAAVAVQAFTLSASTRPMLYGAAFCAGLASGLRSQVAWLTFPLVAFVFVNRFVPARTDGAGAPADRGAGVRPQHALGLAAALGTGVLLWAIPLVVLTGGPTRYWAALSFQGTADISDIQMLWTRHGARDVADAVYYAFIAPWALWPLATAVLVLAAVGAIVLGRRNPRAILALIAAFGPYFVFDVLFQETFTSRYALPLVIPIAYLAASGARALPWQSGAVFVAVMAVYAAHLGGTSVAGFAREKAPAFRLLDDMHSAAAETRDAPVLAMDRKQSFDFRRPIVWADGAVPAFAQVLAAPPQHEWLEAAKLWQSGSRAPVWFVVDPKRTTIDLVQHGPPRRYRWSMPYPVLISGARPDVMDWYRVDSPDWFVGEGWALTPEAAGVAAADRRSLAHGPIRGWIANRTATGVLAVGGRNFESSSHPELTVAINGQTVRQFALPTGSFLEFVPIPALPASETAGFAPLTIALSPPAAAAIEQFDASAARTVFGFGQGWQEDEFNPKTGLRWRWLSERGELRFGAPAPPVMLHLEGESPRTYFSRGSRLVVKAGDRVVFDDVLMTDFALDIPVPNGTQVMTLETDQVFQPADRSRRSQDRRHLGLRILNCEIRPVS
jgi:hypothetical protein